MEQSIGFWYLHFYLNVLFTIFMPAGCTISIVVRYWFWKSSVINNFKKIHRDTLFIKSRFLRFFWPIFYSLHLHCYILNPGLLKQVSRAKILNITLHFKTPCKRCWTRQYRTAWLLFTNIWKSLDSFKALSPNQG